MQIFSTKEVIDSLLKFYEFDGPKFAADRETWTVEILCTEEDHRAQTYRNSSVNTRERGDVLKAKYS